MTAAEQLRALVKEATPGPWVPSPSTTPDGTPGWMVVTKDDAPATWQAIAACDMDRPEGNARLISLAPQLAELVADMGEALAKTTYRTEGYTGPDVWWKSEADALLARLDALFSEEDE